MVKYLLDLEFGQDLISYLELADPYKMVYTDWNNDDNSLVVEVLNWHMDPLTSMIKVLEIFN